MSLISLMHYNGKVGQLSVSVRSLMPPIHLAEWDTVVCDLEVTDATNTFDRVGHCCL